MGGGVPSPVPPEGGSASLEAMGCRVHDGIGALLDGMGLCPLVTVPARAEHGGTGSPPLASREAEPPYSVVHPAAPGVQRGRATLQRPPAASQRRPPAARRIRALPDGIGLCPLVTVPARAGHGGIDSPPVRGHRRAPRRPWPPERPARNRALPARCPCPPGGRRNRGGGVHDGIGALPDEIGLCPHVTVPARAGHGGGTVELARRPCGGIVRILRRLSEPPGGLRRVARPLWRPWAAGCTTE